MDTTRKAAGGSSLPRITVTAEDRERLPGPASAAMDRIPDLAGYLSDELDRAQVVRTGRSVLGFVRMGSEVEFRDDTTGRVQVVSLVYPGEVDIGQGRISVLTPVGAALLGLSKRQSIDWATRTGAAKRLTVLDVREPSSRADTDMPAPASLEERPPLVIPMTDLRSLRKVVTATRPSGARAAVAAWLAEDLDRATDIAPEAFPSRVVPTHGRLQRRFPRALGRARSVQHHAR